MSTPIAPDDSASAMHSTASAIVARPSQRGNRSVSHHSLPIVHHQIPRTKSAATTIGGLADAAIPSVTTAVPAIVPSTAPLCRDAR